MLKYQYIPGLHLPPDLKPSDILWDWDEGHAPETPAQVQAKWNQWRRIRDQIQNEYKREAKALLAEALAGLAEDKRELALIEEMERREEWYRKDSEDTAKYVAGLTAAMDSAWKRAAVARLNRAGNSIRKDAAIARQKKIEENLARLGKPIRKRRNSVQSQCDASLHASRRITLPEGRQGRED